MMLISNGESKECFTMNYISKIEDNIFGSQLIQALYKLQADFPDSHEIDVFIQLCTKKINGSVSNEYLDNPTALSEIKNKEISARWREYLSNKLPKCKKEHFPKAVFTYLAIFNFNDDHYYLIHSLKLVRSAKALFSEDFRENIYKTAANSVLRINISNPILASDILTELFSINPLDTKNDFRNLLNQWTLQLQSASDFTGALVFLSLQKAAKLISTSESKIKIAENYEKNGDFHRSDIQPNTYYPSILSYYKNASRELKSITGEEDLKNRIHRKIIFEQQEHAKMHLAVAKNYSNQNYDIENYIKNQLESWSSLFITYDFESGLSNLLSFPISLNRDVDDYFNNNHTLSPFFNSAVKQDSNGRIVAETTFESYFQSLGKSFLREAIIAFIRDNKYKMDNDKKIDKNYVYMLLHKLQSKFVPYDRNSIYINGILAGFNNDFITAAHLLLPQLENSLKNILDTNNILSFKIDDEIQHDNTLGGILEIYIKKNQHNIFMELKDFLTENSGVNFRNELSHGLASPFIIEHYGVYLWWLTLKLIKDYDEIFTFNK